MYSKVQRATGPLQRFRTIPASFATAAIKGKGRSNGPPDMSASLEQEGARMLRVVRSKMAERERLVQDEVSAPIARVPPIIHALSPYRRWKNPRARLPLPKSSELEL